MRAAPQDEPPSRSSATNSEDCDDGKRVLRYYFLYLVTYTKSDLSPQRINVLIPTFPPSPAGTLWRILLESSAEPMVFYSRSFSHTSRLSVCYPRIVSHYARTRLVSASVKQRSVVMVQTRSACPQQGSNTQTPGLTTPPPLNHRFPPPSPDTSKQVTQFTLI
jgi:hypothetical protein